ncbi:MAG: hypothetical protein QXR73_02420, partial [Candidatus Micrarchaeaceae archaeon]
MEYLMTYGWAILIIAVVLGALFSLGVFSGSSLIGTACIAQSGYYCQNLVYHDGVLSATVGQSTGTTFATANVYFVPSGSVYSGSDAHTALPSNFASGATNTISITITTSLPVAVGTPLTGYLYVNYTTPSTSGTYLVAELATVSVKAS